ncbi:aminotransferase [Sandarakinorhabdus sp.]|uniref:aminotransferase n=1 Tax=Sandarakinorhabdus sp. TaxID=1916663 RepID=UPI00286D712A|nr:aminotransferase [Sandarakinorhabdus sp.]
MQAGTTIFEHMSGLARAHDAVNLGQGFPDFGWSDAVLGAAAEAVQRGNNQYPPMRGLPELRRAVCDHYAVHQGLVLSPDQVIITSGATEALAAGILAVVQPGDEVIVFEPLYDAYLPLIRRAGGVPVPVRLNPPDWRIDAGALAAAISPRTRALILNNPQNPAASVCPAADLDIIAATCAAHDLIAISDEVWEHVLTGDAPHIPLASRPGMAARTIKIGSAGKILALTGWKVGWAVAEPSLAERVAGMHQFLTFTTPPPLQSAVAVGLALPPDWFAASRARLTAAKARLSETLFAAGWHLLPSAGSYFISVDLAASGVAMDDIAFCERAVREVGVAAIPMSAFYAAAPETGLVRLCFAKSDAVLDEGALRLARARDLFSKGAA